MALPYLPALILTAAGMAVPFWKLTLLANNFRIAQAHNKLQVLGKTQHPGANSRPSGRMTSIHCLVPSFRSLCITIT